MSVDRCLPFILAACEHGSMILNRFDHQTVEDPATGKQATYGVGHSLLTSGQYFGDEGMILFHLANKRCELKGEGVYVLDVGANIGAVTVPLARKMFGWGYVVAIEAQEWSYYALAGNLALNNLFNARALRIAVGAENGTLRIPVLNPSAHASFGSLELKPTAYAEDIGQQVDYANGETVDLRTIDSLGMGRLDLMKIDVEGMEQDVIDGAAETIAREHPIIFVETLKTSASDIASALARHGYSKSHVVGLNLLFIHPDDPTASIIREA